MEYTTVKLLPEFENRYKFKANLYAIQQKRFMEVTVFLDTGCYNTLIPSYFARLSGRSLGFKRGFNIMGSAIETEAFVIDKLMIGDVVLERVVAFASEFGGGLGDEILLGTNVLNNWDMTIHKKTHTFKFREDPPDDIPNRERLYQNYFDSAGNYVHIQIPD